MSLYSDLTQAQSHGKRKFALLLDPDKCNLNTLPHTLHQAKAAGVDYLFVGGSLVSNLDLTAVIAEIKAHTALPVVLFPGSVHQLSAEADALLFLSLISGRNPDLLIGQHVQAAPLLHQLVQTGLEILPTGYMLVDTGRATAASYMSATQPLPAHKPDLAAYTALAGEYLGLKLIYADAGSGAQEPIPTKIVRAIRQVIHIPLIVGGGIRHVATAEAMLEAGADVLVVGTALEGADADQGLLAELAGAVRHYSLKAHPR